MMLSAPEEGRPYLEAYTNQMKQTVTETKDGKQAVYAKTRAAWQKWLKQKQSKGKVCLVNLVP